MSKLYQKLQTGRTLLLPSDEQKFESYRKTLPSNLKPDTEQYDLRGYWQGNNSPKSFDYSQPKESDGFYHASSRNPITGMILKAKSHPTYKMAIENDVKSGYFPYEKNGRTYTDRPFYLKGYQQGGTLSQLGYKRHSPYNKAPSLLINTPTGSITMKEVDHPILGIGHNEIKFMLPNKEYQFKSNKVLEIPMKSIYPKKYQQGGRSPKVYTDKKEYLKAKQSYSDSLDLYNMSKDVFNLNNYTESIHRGVDDKLKKWRRVSSYNIPGPNRIENEDKFKKSHNMKDSKNKNDYILRGIKPIALKDWGEFDDDFTQIPIYKKPNQPVIYQEPIQPRMSEMTPVQTIQPQVQDSLVQRPITMKTIYPSKPHVWNTSTPKRHSVERAPGLGGYNRIYQEGGQAPEMSPEQQQEIVRRVRNLRKTIGYNKVGSVPLDGIQFRHYMYVNKKKLQKEDEELLGAFDEDQMVKLMNDVPDENEIPMGQAGMRMPNRNTGFYMETPVVTKGRYLGNVSTYGNPSDMTGEFSTYKPLNKRSGVYGNAKVNYNPYQGVTKSAGVGANYNLPVNKSNVSFSGGADWNSNTGTGFYAGVNAPIINNNKNTLSTSYNVYKNPSQGEKYMGFGDLRYTRTFKKGGKVGSRMYPKCKCGCGGVSVKGGMKFSGGGELGKGGTQAVADYQIKLNKLGANLKVDGQWGDLTQKAYERYKETEIPFNGVLNQQINKKEAFGKSMVASFPMKEYEEIISRDKTHLPLEQQFKLEFGKYGNFNNEKIKTIFDNSNRSNSRLFVEESQRVENIKNPVIKAQELSGLKTLFQNITNPEWIKKDYQRRTLQQKEAHKKQLETASENQYKKQQARNKALGLPDTFNFEGSVNADSVLAKQSQPLQVSEESISQYDLQKKYLKKKGMKFQQGGTMDVLDEDGNSQMTIVGGERIFSRVATSKMLMLNEGGKFFELGKFVCDELSAQEKRKPQYVKE